MQGGEGHGVGNVFDSECGAGNSLDKEQVDVVVVDDVDKMPACDVPTPDTNKDQKKDS